MKVMRKESVNILKTSILKKEQEVIEDAKENC